MIVTIIDNRMKEILPDKGKILKNKDTGDYINSIYTPLSFDNSRIEECNIPTDME